MQKSILALTLGSTAMLGACATNPAVTQDAAIGAVGGAAVGAVVPGVSVIEGAAVGAAIGGLAGAAWADNNNDGYVDGYMYNGQYYPGTPQGYDPNSHSVLASAATGAVGGAALGAVAGAVLPGVSILQGAVIGAAVGGLAGAVWADRNNDGVVDGYVYNGQYYNGPPAGYNGTAVPAPAPAPMPAPAPVRGERG
jgi:phage tail tape-measure protein